MKWVSSSWTCIFFCHYFLDIKYKKNTTIIIKLNLCCAADGPTRTVHNFAHEDCTQLCTVCVCVETGSS